MAIQAQTEGIPGGFHIHTTYSDGQGSYPEIIAAAKAAGLQWLIITDHDSLGGKAYEGWHDGVLVLVGHEITPERNHCIALGVDYVIKREQAPQSFMDETYAQGGFNIIAHPEGVLGTGSYWEDWEVAGPRAREGKVVGLELWNVMSDWRAQKRRFPQWFHAPFYFLPKPFLLGPTVKTLAWWDKLNMAGKRTFGVGGLDAHAFPRKRLGQLLTIFPYRKLFETLTNYLVLEGPLDRDGKKGKEQVFKALQEGRNYLVNRLYGDASKLQFMAVQGDKQWRMGDTVSLKAGPLLLTAEAGSVTHLKLVQNGKVIAQGIGKLQREIKQPGIYRLEGRRWGQAWLYTNPLYVVE